MQALEDELDVRLLERSTRSVHLTEAGGIFYQHCKRIVEESISALTSVQQLSEAPRGTLKVSASVSTGQYLLAPHIGAFLETYPELHLDLQLDNRRVDIIAEGFDVAVRIGDLPDSNLISKRLGTGHAQLYASPGYLTQQGMPKRIEDLDGHRMLVMSEMPNPNQWTLRNKQHEQKISFTPRASINDFYALLQMITDDSGIGLLPTHLTKEPVELGDIQRVLPGWKTAPYHFHALYPGHQSITLKLRAWLDFFAERLKA
jgi:LysR family transcriptional regulator AphB